MRKIFFLLTGIFLFSVLSYSQVNTDSLRRAYSKNVILLDIPSYFKNGERANMRYMKTEFDLSEEGLNLFTAGMKKYRLGRIIQYVSLAGLMLYPAYIRNPDRETIIGIMAGGLIIGSIGAHINIAGRKQIQKSVWIRNKDTLFPLK